MLGVSLDKDNLQGVFAAVHFHNNRGEEKPEIRYLENAGDSTHNALIEAGQ